MQLIAMLCKDLENQLPKNRQNWSCKILIVQLKNSIAPIIFNKFQQFVF